MSTVFDIETIVADDTEINVEHVPTTITLEDAITPLVIDIEIPNAIQVVTIEVPGPQGPPGVQNVYVQSTDPSTGWGVEEENYVWIEPL